MKGITDEQADKMASNLGFTGNSHSQAAEQIKRMYEFFLSVDATQVEINPFGKTPSGDVVCFDSKISFDENAAYRQKDIFAMDDKAEVDAREIEAEKNNLNYIGLDGSIGCFVNGAGLAMATMDMIKLCAESRPTSSTVEGVNSVLVNIFGGIVNCATVATGIVNAAKALGLNLPLIVRLEGQNVEAAKKILADSQLPIISVNGFEEAARKAPLIYTVYIFYFCQPTCFACHHPSYPFVPLALLLI
ncbi:SUCLG2 [Bugula neritina]|uniref:SUCLG2 n=1 Tax=Bugula neritina TaxID=10212 RepID=A0A7J7JNB5_BUGNE|nr:SUCLG2 [Bugula neritina]